MDFKIWVGDLDSHTIQMILEKMDNDGVTWLDGESPLTPVGNNIIAYYVCDRVLNYLSDEDFGGGESPEDYFNRNDRYDVISPFDYLNIPSGGDCSFNEEEFISLIGG